MMRRFLLLAHLAPALVILAATPVSNPHAPGHQEPAPEVSEADSVARSDSAAVIHRLTETDYREVAEKLGVEVAAIKAVVDIEAGRSHQGFHKPGQPLINFDLTMFRRFAGRRGINLSKYLKTHPEVFARPNAQRYGSTQAAQQARLSKARTIDEPTAIEGTFWGMFQIGGFNWKKCGCESMEEFVEKMSLSERDQLDLFANFLVSTGLDRYLRAKNWVQFAKGYNGPSYASRGYHTRMAAAYNRHRREEALNNPGLTSAELAAPIPGDVKQPAEKEEADKKGGDQ